jgi:hypothetical protein
MSDHSVCNFSNIKGGAVSLIVYGNYRDEGNMLELNSLENEVFTP